MPCVRRNEEDEEEEEEAVERIEKSCASNTVKGKTHKRTFIDNDNYRNVQMWRRVE